MVRRYEKLYVNRFKKMITSQIVDMSGMFFGCSGLTSLDVSNFDTSKVTDMFNMFNGCSKLTPLNVSNFNTSNVTDMSHMFAGCSDLTSLDLSNFDTSKVTDIGGMFYHCSLSKLTLGNSFVISSNIEIIFPIPTKTFSGIESDGTWGLGSENASKKYTAKELTNLGKTAGALAGTWYAQSAGTYTIKFDPNGGTGTMDNETMTVGGTQALTANAFTRTGYLFKSWNTKADGSGTSYADKASVKNLTTTSGATVTLYAQWEPKTYKNTITHWLYGFKNQEGNSRSKEAFHLGDSFFEGVFGKGTTLDSSKGITLPNGISLSNYLGYTDPTAGKWVSRTIPNTVTQPDKAMTYQLNYSPIAYKLTYNLLGGSNDSANPSSYNVLYGVTLKDAKRTGYTFNGWTDQNGKKVTGINQGANATFSSPDDLYSKLAARITGDMVLTAGWKANTYTIAFNGNGNTGGSTANETMTYDAAKALTVNGFTKTHYHFAGWNSKADGSGTAYADNASVKNLASSGTVTLYAQWEIDKHYLDMNGYLDGKGSGNIKDFGTADIYINGNKVADDVDDYYAQWPYGTTYEIKDIKAKTGKTYDGVYSGSIKGTIGDSNIGVNLKFHTNTYTIKYSAGGGSGSMNDTAMTYGTAKTLSANQFTRNGYTFSGWSDSDGKSYSAEQSVNNLTATDKGTVTMTAKWKPNTYSVSFNANGGNGSMSSESMTYDAAKALTTNSFTRAHYNFTGWNTKADGSGTSYADKASVKNLTATNGATVTLYAKWTPNTYTVKFNANGGTGTMTDEGMTYDSAKTLTGNTLTRKGYTFTGWNTKADGTGTAYADKASVKNLAASGTVTLYAQWKIQSHTLTVDPNGGTWNGSTSSSKITQNYNTQKAISAPTRSGYTFVGWAATGSGTMVDETSDNAFANNKWQANSVAYDNEKSGANSISTEAAEADNPLKIKGVTKYQGVFKNDGSKKTSPQLGGWLVRENSSANSRHIVSFIAKAPKGYYLHYANNPIGTGGYTKWLTPNAGTGEWTTYAYEVFAGPNGTFQDFGYTYLSKSKDSIWGASAQGAVTVKIAAESIMNVTLSTTKTYTFGDSDGTLTALWAPNTHKATLDSQGATAKGTENIWWFTNTSSLYNGNTSWYYEDEKTEKVLGRDSKTYPNYQLTIPKKTGYTFGGYFTGKNGTGTQYTSKDGAIINSLYKQDSDMTLYAKWDPNTYTVKYDPNGGTGTMANETMTYDASKPLTANAFTNKDYDFIGWNTAKDGSGSFYTDKSNVKNLATSGTVTLYAQWNYNPHVFLPKSGGKGVITIGLVSAFCILAYAEREILKKRKEIKR